MSTSKAELMRQLRKQRAEQGLVPVTVYVRPEHKKRLQQYVQHRLFGEAPKR